MGPKLQKFENPCVETCEYPTFCISDPGLTSSWPPAQLLLEKKKTIGLFASPLIWRQPCKLGHQAGDNWACNYEKSKMQMKVWIRRPVKTTSGHLTYFLS